MRQSDGDFGSSVVVLVLLSNQVDVKSDSANTVKWASHFASRPLGDFSS